MIYFRITIGANHLTTVPIGVVTGGYRLQVTYGDGITFDGFTSDGDKLSGKVIAGNRGCFVVLRLIGLWGGNWVG